MSGLTLGLLGFLGMLVLIALRMPIGLAMFVAGAAGYTYLTNFTVLLNYLKTTPYHLFANYTLSVIPLFILMGAFAEKSGLSTDLFKAAVALIGHWRGGLATAVIWACVGFGAICGSSVATTATFGRAALPELRRYGYDLGVSTGTIAVGGTLGILIPPSVILVVYAISTEQNIAKLFLAAFVPGLLAATFYTIAIVALAYFRPKLMPQHARTTVYERMSSVAAVWPALGAAGLILGGIYGGVFTPTEGAAVGAVLLLAIAVIRRTLSWPDFLSALRNTAGTSAMIFAILLGAEVFNAFLALTHLPEQSAAWIGSLGLSPYAVVALMMVFYLILGGVMDELAMILLTLPVFFPIITTLDFGLPPDEVAIWFGILVLIVVGIGLSAPPMGLNVFVISAIARDVPISATYRGVLPYVAMDAIRLLLVLLVPDITLTMVRWLG